MKIHSLYRDFFKFLDKTTPQSEKWKIYLKLYFEPHREFLDTYFSHFPLIDSVNLKERVEAVKASHYSRLRDLVSACPPEKIVRQASKECVKILFPKEEPEAYLFIGFFSPDSFVMEFRGKPVICFGLERFRDFHLFKILFAHEYAHFLLNLSRGGVPDEKRLKWHLISEGIATFFSSVVFPHSRLSDHFLFRRDKLNWCQENEDKLREIYCSGKYPPSELLDFYLKGSSELMLPPRAAKYLAYQAVKKYIEREQGSLGKLFSDKSIALSLLL